MSVAPEPYLTACLEVLYFATVDARVLGAMGSSGGIGPADAARLDDLMDAVHNLPRLLNRWETVDEQAIRDYLRNYDEKWAAHSRIHLLPIYEQAIARGAG